MSKQLYLPISSTICILEKIVKKRLLDFFDANNFSALQFRCQENRGTKDVLHFFLSYVYSAV